MQLRNTLTLAATVAALLAGTGCAVSRGQESVGAYVDDATITTVVKSRFVKNDQVNAGAIKVETLNGTVMLSGFARSAEERRTAEMLAADVKGVRGVRNAIVVRPS
ncbi:BON domain-containing protein [Variovorax ureilyticus]|uniref:BON domain-containing protein n=1 Tax=Variovorax ureilyticus TaxID=1836198 RepID=UPI003D6675CE